MLVKICFTCILKANITKVFIILIEFLIKKQNRLISKKRKLSLEYSD